MGKSFNLRILNGRKLGDMKGGFTHYNNTVDLGIVSENFFSHIEKFMIFPQTELSDHCKITLQIPNMINLKTNSASYKWVQLKRAYKWSDNLRFRYQKAFNKGKIQKMINDLKQNYSTDSIDVIGKRVIDILQAVGKVSLH